MLKDVGMIVPNITETRCSMQAKAIITYTDVVI